MYLLYKAKCTTPDGRELEHDTMNLDQAKFWCRRWVDDGRADVRVTVIHGEGLWTKHTSRTYRYLTDLNELSPEERP